MHGNMPFVAATGKQKQPPRALLLIVTNPALAYLGPSWRRMTESQRRRYPSEWTARDWAAHERRDDA